MHALDRTRPLAIYAHACMALQALTTVVVKSKAQTLMGLDADLKEAAAALQRCNPTAISLKAGCALFLRYTTRSSALEDEDFASAKARIIEVPAYCSATRHAYHARCLNHS